MVKCYRSFLYFSVYPSAQHDDTAGLRQALGCADKPSQPPAFMEVNRLNSTSSGNMTKAMRSGKERLMVRRAQGMYGDQPGWVQGEFPWGKQREAWLGMNWAKEVEVQAALHGMIQATERAWAQAQAWW